MNILITGCNGQLGNEMQRLQTENTQHRWFNTDVSELDITRQSDVEQFVSTHEIDGIVNCAAYTAVDQAESNLQLCTALNAEAPAYLAAAVAKRDGWMVQISTDYVFDGTHHIPYIETDTPCPNSVYGDTKLAGELAVQRFCSRSAIVRTAWLYSRFGNNFVKTMLRLGRERKELGVIFDQIGTPTYARDLARAIFTMIEAGIRAGVYHFSNLPKVFTALRVSIPAVSVRCARPNILPPPSVRPTACSIKRRLKPPTASRYLIGKNPCASVSPRCNPPEKS